jgi:hypothetical protein
MRTTRIHNVIAAALLAAGTMTVPALSHARSAIQVYVAPPAPIVETVPGPRAGYTWAPGYWHWNGHRHTWARGHWERNRAGHHWVANRWERQGNGWKFHDGYWARG